MLRPKPSSSNSSIEGAPGYENISPPNLPVTIEVGKLGQPYVRRVESPSSACSNSSGFGCVGPVPNHKNSEKENANVLSSKSSSASLSLFLLITIVTVIIPTHPPPHHLPPRHDDHAVSCNLSTPQCHRLVGSGTVYPAMVPNSPRWLAQMKYEHLRFWTPIIAMWNWLRKRRIWYGLALKSVSNLCDEVWSCL